MRHNWKSSWEGNGSSGEQVIETEKKKREGKRTQMTETHFLTPRGGKENNQAILNCLSINLKVTDKVGSVQIIMSAQHKWDVMKVFGPRPGEKFIMMINIQSRWLPDHFQLSIIKLVSISPQCQNCEVIQVIGPFTSVLKWNNIWQ